MEYERIISDFNTLNVDDILCQLDIELVYEETMNKNMMEALLKIFERHATIFIKTNINENYRRFVIFHEIGHYLLHYEVDSHYSYYSSRYKNKLENQANNFACECLLFDDDIQDINIIELLVNKGVPYKIAVSYYEYYQNQ